jgi:hypothetical protein
MNNFHYHQDPLYSAAAHILEGTAEVQAIVADFAVGDSTNFGKVLEIGSDSITFKAKDLPKTKISFKQRKMGSSEFLLTKLIKLKEETLGEASMDSLSLSDLWNKHREYTYAADQGWGGGYGSAKGGKAAAEAIYKFVATKYDKKTAEDMQDASENYLAHQEYVGGAEARSAEADEAKLRKKYGIKEETLDEGAYKPLRKPEDLIAELQSIVDAPDAKLWDVTSVSIRVSHEDVFDRFPKIYDYIEDMWEAIMTPNGARKTKEIAKKAIEAVHKYYPIKEETEASEETLDEADTDPKMQGIDKKIEALMKQRTELETEDDDLQKYISSAIERDEARGNDPEENDSISTAKKELSDIQDKHAKVDSEIQKLRAEKKSMNEAINWLGDYLPTSEKSKFGGYRPTIINKKTKGLMYQSAAAYNTPDEAKDHAEDYLKQKSKGIRDPKVPIVGTYKEETEEVTEAVDPATKRRKQLDMARVNAGAMSRDDYNKKYKLGKYSPAGSKLSGPGGLYKNLVKEVLNPDDDASVWIDDFVKSDDPRFEGKSKEERIKMALGAWYAAQKKESVEPTAEALEEATMTTAEKKTAEEVHKVLKDGEQTSPVYADRIRAMRKQLIAKFGNDWRQKAGITEESLEEAVPLPSVKKVIDIVDEMSPKEYSNFLHALADNAFGIAMSTKRIKPNGPSNSDAWEDVADGIRDAAKAYDARPVKMSEGVEDETQTLEEGLYPLTKKALDATFNLDPDEFEEFLKELAKNLNNEGDDTGYDEWYQVADHIEKAHMIWKKRDSNI